MKTKHFSRHIGAERLGQALTQELYENRMRGAQFRFIQMGAGLVVLPDTDLTKDATEGEVIKALGLRDKAEKVANEDNRTTYMVSAEGDFHSMIELTPAQERLLRWCQSEGLLWSEVVFSKTNSNIIKI